MDATGPVQGDDALETLLEATDGTVVAPLRAGAEAPLLFLPRFPADGVRERERIGALAGTSVPRAGPARDESEAVEYEGTDGSRPLGPVTPLPDGAWRRALVGLLGVVARAHGHGWAHTRLAEGHVFARPDGSVWVRGWGAAREIGCPGAAGSAADDVGRDLRDLGVLFVRALGGGEETPPSGPVDPDLLGRARARAALFDAELARVVARMVTIDPRESYLDATEVLTDLGESEPSRPQPWGPIPLAGRGKLVRRLRALLGTCSTSESPVVEVRISGPSRSGRTRLLDELSRIARDCGADVIQAGGGAAHPTWGAIGGIARQLVSRLPADDPLREDAAIRSLTGVVPGIEPVRSTHGSVGDRSDDALLRLAEAVFRRATGVVLLDDEDALPGHARHAWRALSRHVASAAADDDPIRVLLVSTTLPGSSDESPEPHIEVRPIGELGRRELGSILGRLLTDRGSALPLADEILAHTGGLPGDVAEALFEMVSRGVLLPVGRFLAVQRTAGDGRLVGAPPRSPLAGAPREAAALASVLAVAGPLRLPRSTLAEIAGIDGSRLGAAGDAGIRANLVVRDGATWRIRTESVRAQTERSMSDDRRKSVHREILAFLLDQEPPDRVSIARHARECGDPRAVEWTHEALRILRDAGRHQEASSHFEEARVALPAGSLDLGIRVEQIDSMLRSGRLGAAIRLANEVRADPAATPQQRGRATMSLAWLLRYDQSWTKVLSLDLPHDCGEPRVLGEMRAVRAHAMFRLGRTEAAAREERLALAEVTEPADVEAVQYALMDMKASDTRDLAACQRSCRAALEALRLARRRGDDVRAVLSMTALALLTRHIGNGPASILIVSRLESWVANHGRVQPLTAWWIASTRTAVLIGESRHRAAECDCAAAAMWADRTDGMLSRALAQIRIVAALCRSGHLPPRRYAWFRTWASTATATFEDVAPTASPAVASSLTFCGLHSTLTQLLGLHVERRSDQFVRRVFEYWSLTSRWYLGGLDETASDPPAVRASLLASERHASALMLSVRGPDEVYRPEGVSHRAASVALVSAALLRGLRGGDSWPTEWTDDELAHLVEEQPDGWVNAAILAAALVVVARGSMSLRLRVVSEKTVRELDRQFPTPLEWLRSLALARVRYDGGQVVRALAHMEDARRLVGVLDRPESGDLGGPARQRAMGCVERYGIHLRRAEVPRLGLRLPLVPEVAWPDWDAAIRTALVGRRTLVVCEDAEERDLFLSLLAPALAALAECDRPRVTLFDPATGGDAAPAADAAGRVLVIAALDPQSDGQAFTRVTQWCGSVVRVTSPLSRPGGRMWLVRRIARNLGIPGQSPDADAEAEIEGYPWPGRVREMTAFVTELAAAGRRDLRRADLDAVGWSARRELQELAPAHPLEPLAIRFLSAHPASSTGEIAASLGCSVRTVIRVLGRLVGEGAVVCVGRGRATRYSAGPGRQPVELARDG